VISASRGLVKLGSCTLLSVIYGFVIEYSGILFVKEVNEVFINDTKSMLLKCAKYTLVKVLLINFYVLVTGKLGFE
jgi:hypothetical protein